MKFSTISFLALPLLAFAAPAPAPVAASEVESAPVERRQIASAYSIVSDLYTEIQQYTGNINATAATITSSSTTHQKKVAAKTFRENIREITSAVRAAKKQTDALSPASKEKRQTEAALAGLVENLLLEISGALNNIIGTLGLSELQSREHAEKIHANMVLASLLGSLNPLVSSLSALLLSLEAVVNNLLAVVQQLLDGLLTGLSVGLAGLTL